MVDYLIASAIDVDTSVLEMDFDIIKHQCNLPASGFIYEAADIAQQRKDLERIAKYESTQYEFVSGKKSKILGIDAIYIP